MLFLIPVVASSQNYNETNKKKSEYKGNFGSVDFNYNKSEVLPVEHAQSDKIQINSNWWYIPLFFIFFAFIVYIYYNYNQEINLIVKATFNNVFFRQLLNNKNSVIVSFINILNVAFFISVSVLSILFIDSYSIITHKDSLLTYVIVLFSLSLFFLLKVITSKIWSLSIDKKIFSEINILSIKISNAFISIFLIFLIFITIYNPVFSERGLFLSIFFILIIFFLRIYKEFKEFFHQGLSLFYFILYLCTVEIFPVLITLKLFSIQKF